MLDGLVNEWLGSGWMEEEREGGNDELMDG